MTILLMCGVMHCGYIIALLFYFANLFARRRSGCGFQPDITNLTVILFFLLFVRFPCAITLPGSTPDTLRAR